MSKAFFCSISLFAIALSCAAQQKTYKTIYQDTIHLRGIVYNYLGKPQPKVTLFSKNLKPDGIGELWTTTDSVGRFELIGAKPKDTIFVTGSIPTIVVYNEGSRYMEITLAQIKPFHINDPDQLIVSAERKTVKKKIPVKFEITNQECFDCGIGGNEHPADFPGGIDRFVTYVRKRLTYPEQAVKNGIEGTVEIGFLITKNGTPTNFRVLRGIGYGCDDEIINIIKTAPKWKPGISSGHALDYPESISIQFKLTDK